jgi:hypothetical protein
MRPVTRSPALPPLYRGVAGSGPLDRVRWTAVNRIT